MELNKQDSVTVNVEEEKKNSQNEELETDNEKKEETHTNTDKPLEIVTFKVPSLKLIRPINEFSEDKETKTDTNLESSSENVDVKSSKSLQPKQQSLTKLSPAELLRQSEIPIPYKEPSWGGTCKEKYLFEIVKSGTVINKLDLSTKSYFIFGRLPSCDVPMEHPSLSRHHAVVQYCTKKSEQQDIGWYLYDLDSTHGTWLNKNKIKSRIFYRLRVGHIIKFGGSSRLHVLQV